MEWISMVAPKGYVATIPRDEQGYYCPVCGFFLDCESFYFEDGEYGMDVPCPRCRTSSGGQDVPPLSVDGFGDYLENVKRLRTRWLWFEGYGPSALQQISSICPFIETELDQYHQPGEPALVYWQRLDEQSVASLSKIGLVIKCMLCTKTGQFVRRVSSDHPGSFVGCLSYPLITLSTPKINLRIQYLQEAREGYYKTPPPDAVWI